MNILDLVITILIVVASVLLVIKKKSKQMTSYDESYNDDEDPEWETPFEEPKWETILQKTAKNNPDLSFYNNFEKMGNKGSEILKKDHVSVQDVESEKKAEDTFLLSHEEMRKAVIYSEIIKRPYFWDKL